jgi:tRNA G18 (ribose-2'-O)-methylase SpoU
MGAHFRLPIHSLTWEAIYQIIAPLQIFLADASAPQLYSEAEFLPPTAFIIGGEAHGHSGEIQVLHPVAIRIPMPGGMESLNVSVAAGILLFEAVRQRAREKAGGHL